MAPECFDRYNFDYIGLRSFDLRVPRSDAQIDHIRWTLRDPFSHVCWFKKRRAAHNEVNTMTMAAEPEVPERRKAD